MPFTSFTPVPGRAQDSACDALVAAYTSNSDSDSRSIHSAIGNKYRYDNSGISDCANILTNCVQETLTLTVFTPQVSDSISGFASSTNIAILSSGSVILATPSASPSSRETLGQYLPLGNCAHPSYFEEITPLPPSPEYIEYFASLDSGTLYNGQGSSHKFLNTSLHAPELSYDLSSGDSTPSGALTPQRPIESAIDVALDLRSILPILPDSAAFNLGRGTEKTKQSSQNNSPDDISGPEALSILSPLVQYSDHESYPTISFTSYTLEFDLFQEFPDIVDQDASDDSAKNITFAPFDMPEEGQSTKAPDYERACHEIAVGMAEELLDSDEDLFFVEHSRFTSPREHELEATGPSSSSIVLKAHEKLSAEVNGWLTTVSRAPQDGCELSIIWSSDEDEEDIAADYYFDHPPSEEQDDAPVVILEHLGVTYTITGELGRGAFGRVVFARTSLGDEVAIKIFGKTSSKNTPEQHRQSILNEKQILARVTAEDNPFVTQLLVSFQDQNNVYFVMRMFPQNLSGVFTQALETDIPVSKLQIKQFASELVHALMTLDDLHIVHRDLKPDNILISPNGHVAIADFGFAKMFSKATWPSARMHQAMGTCGYIAPEMFDEHIGEIGYTSAVDTWAFGVILFEMFLGKQYINEYTTSEQEFANRRVHLRIHGDIDRHVQDENAVELLHLLLATDPDDRPSWAQVRSHPYFRGINWKKMAARKTPIDFVKPIMDPLRTYCPASIDESADPIMMGDNLINFECAETKRFDFLHGRTFFSR